MNSLEKYMELNPGYQEERLGLIKKEEMNEYFDNDINQTIDAPLTWTETRTDELEDSNQLEFPFPKR